MSDTDKEEGKKLFDFEPNQPDRKFDQSLMNRLYNYSLLELANRNLSLISQFMRIASISFTTTGEIVPTACIMIKPHNTRVIINVNFILDIVVKPYDVENPPKEEDFTDPNKFADAKKHYQACFKKATQELASVLAHEISHNLLDHASNFYEPLKSPNLRNAAQDVYINHMLKSLGFSLEWTRPYLSYDILKYLSPYVEGTDPQDQHFVQKCNRIEATVKEIYNYMKKQDPNFQEPQDQVVYIGSHNGENKDGEGEGQAQGKQGEKCPDDVAGMIREMAKGCSKFGEFFEDYIMVEKQKNKNFEKALKMAQKLNEISGQVSRFLKAEEKGDIEQSTNRPPRSLSKREKQMVAEGVFPPFFKRWEGRTRVKAVIYLDVSGSIYDLVPYLYGMISKAADVFDLDIYEFSTELHKMTLDDIKKGIVKTTGGTCFNTYMENIVEEEYKKVIVISDGYGDYDGHYNDYVKQNKVEINYLLTDGGRLPEYAKAVAKNVWDLEESKM